MLAAGDRDLGPGAQVDAVARAERDRVAGRDVAAVDRDAVLRAQVDERPGAVGPGDEPGVLAGDARVSRVAQVDFRLDAPGLAAAADEDLGAPQGDAPLWQVIGEAH